MQVGALIAHLQSFRGQQLWVAESAAGGDEPTALGGSLPTLVNSIVAAMFFQSDLRARWAAEALQWLLESNNPQHVTLSHQVHFRQVPTFHASQGNAELLQLQGMGCAIRQGIQILLKRRLSEAHISGKHVGVCFPAQALVELVLQRRILA